MERIEDSNRRRTRQEEVFNGVLGMVATALRDNGIKYSIFSSAAFNRQLERELPFLERNAAAGDARAGILSEHAREFLQQIPSDIDGVVPNNDELHRLPMVFERLANFQPIGFRHLPGQENTEAFLGEFRFPNPESPDDRTKDNVIPIEFFCERKVNTPQMIARAESVDRTSGLRVHALHDLRAQYGNVLLHETAIKKKVEDEEAKLRMFVAVLRDPKTEDPEALLGDFADENGMANIASAKEYIEKFERIERARADAVTPEQQLLCENDLMEHLEHLKTKIPQRMEKIAFLDDLYKYLDHGGNGNGASHMDERRAA